MTTAILKAGSGFTVGQDFGRVKVDTPIDLTDEYAKHQCVIGYIAGNPASTLGFMRHERVRVHTLIANVVQS